MCRAFSKLKAEVSHKVTLTTWWAKLNGANAVSFVVVKHVLENFDNFWQVKITVHLRTFRSIKLKYFSPEGATKANHFLCGSILAVLLTHNFYILCAQLTRDLSAIAKFLFYNCVRLLQAKM